MIHLDHRFYGAFLVFLAALAVGRPSLGGGGAAPDAVSGYFAELDDDLDGNLRFVSDEIDSEFWLTQTQPPTQPGVQPIPARRPRSRSQLVAARRRRSTYRLPGMFGDFYGGSSLLATLTQTPFGNVNFPAGGAAVRRVKIGENNSSIPRDRFIFNYSFFNDVNNGIGDVNRYTFGFERTLFSEDNSIEIRFPMASSLDVVQIAGGMPARDTAFGDLTLIYKQVLVERDQFLISAGLGLTLPTGEDARVFNTTGQQIIDLEHSSTHLLPFVGMLHTLDSGWYWQAFVQLDVDMNGNPISADISGISLKPIGVLQDQTLMFVDVGVGYWLREPGQGTSAVALTAELHWSGTLQNTDTVTGIGLNITNPNNRYDVLNITVGASVLVNECFTVRPAMVIPLGHADGEQFDFEAMVQMNFWR